MCQAFIIKSDNWPEQEVSTIQELKKLLNQYLYLDIEDFIHHVVSDQFKVALKQGKRENSCLCCIDFYKLFGRIVELHVNNMDTITITGF